MKRFLLALAVVVGCVSVAPAGEFLGLATGILAMRRPKPAPVPTPAPKPSPGGVCDNCNGTGILGDGTIKLKCPVCDGSGKKTTEPAAPPVVVVPEPTEEPDPPPTLPHYPIRSRWWSGCGNWRHLTVGRHAGKFDHAWLASLSHEELQSLHSDDHEGRTKWEFVVRPLQAVQPKAAAPPRSDCPSGHCPQQRSSGLLRRRAG
jgi:hypothetical protein